MSKAPLLEKKEEEPIFIADEAGEDGPASDKPFNYNEKGLSSAEAQHLLDVHGPNSLPEKKIPKWKTKVL